ncbi:uroporphyrinogen-III synthase [Niabella ginsengisoli]|uniref:Tetrapyrrole biosynthesis uroporphyrinogen III synthase domain-containing protein n=1 Tax=Niabella ginsengisoli TaxID=522298 RepID=A0ABS9SEW6_9BACT|nr:hypothetical protein [Niabella ginsengisoli]MCH5596893.1 hypothetical protein [Niabella ginsengisoli]
MNVLSTKILDDAIVKKAAEHSINISCLPFIESRQINKEELAATINMLAEKQINAIFTSSKSVAAVASVLPQQPRWTIYCLFGATKQNVQKYFPEAIIHANAKDSAALAEQIIKDGLREIHFFVAIKEWIQFLKSWLTRRFCCISIRCTQLRQRRIK